MPHLLDLILDHSFDAAVGENCHCGTPGAKRTTRCHDCFFFLPSCSKCFILSHINLPSHWADVWNENKGFFVRHDVATLEPDIASINLGHNGLPCPSKHASNLLFCLIATNGIHNTKIRFCFCQGSPNRTEQLMRARLFPATVTQPVMAFTFQVLQQFHLHHLESKESAYDFIGALRRLTDNAFPQRVSVCFFCESRPVVTNLHYNSGPFVSISSCDACLATFNGY
jgi:CxC2 like cysteine cluster associated with KDZ transposases